MKHTPGPWKHNTDFHLYKKDEYSEISAGNGYPPYGFSIQTVISDADAKVIAAAPELLAALIGLVNDVRNKPNDTRYATHIKIAEAAINKATGVQVSDTTMLP